MLRVKRNYYLPVLLLAAILLASPACIPHGEKIGVIYVIHGGMSEYNPQYMWDAAVHQFSFDPNHYGVQGRYLEPSKLVYGSGYENH